MVCGSLDPSTEPRGRKIQRRASSWKYDILTACQLLPLGHTHPWPGSELPGLTASSWRLPGIPSLGLAIAVDALSTTEEPCDMPKLELYQVIKCEPKSRSWAMWGAAGGNPGCSPRKVERTVPSKAPPGFLYLKPSCLRTPSATSSRD